MFHITFKHQLNSENRTWFNEPSETLLQIVTNKQIFEMRLHNLLWPLEQVYHRFSGLRQFMNCVYGCIISEPTCYGCVHSKLQQACSVVGRMFATLLQLDKI